MTDREIIHHQKKKSRAGNNRGVALVVTIAVVTLLVATVLELNKKVRSSVISSVATRDRLTLSYMAQSGIQAGMAILIEDKKKDIRENKEIDTIMEAWADPEKVAEVVQGISFEAGSLSLEISDELGKIQVNALVNYPKGREFNVAQQTLWDQFLRPIISLDEEAELNATTDIINSVKDWLDLGDDEAITGLNGAESDYYLSLDPPYSCKNGPFTHLSELLMVKGMKPEYFEMIGGAALKEFAGVLQSLGGGEALQGLGGDMLKGIDPSMLDKLGEINLDELGISSDISDFMTVNGMTRVDKGKEADGRAYKYEGKININTAGLPVLAAILPLGADKTLAASIYEYRKYDPEKQGFDDSISQLISLGKSNKDGKYDDLISQAQNLATVPPLWETTWYTKAPGCEALKIDPNLIMLKSDFFRIKSTATLNAMKMTITAVVQREKMKNEENNQKWHCKVLSWEAI